MSRIEIHENVCLAAGGIWVVQIRLGFGFVHRDKFHPVWYPILNFLHLAGKCEILGDHHGALRFAW